MAMFDTQPRHLGADDAAAYVLRSFRRVSWLSIDPTSGRCVVVGVRHRLPARMAVSLDVAMALRRRGVRTVVRSAGSAGSAA